MSASDAFMRAKLEREENIRLQVAERLNYDSEEAARIFKIGGQTGLPEDFIASNLPDLEDRVRERNFDPQRYRETSPNWATFAAENPYNLTVMKDDQEHMGSWDRAMTQIGLGWNSSWATVEYGRINFRHSEGRHEEGDDDRLKEYQQLMVPHQFGAEGLTSFIVKNAMMIAPTLYVAGKSLEGALAGASFGAGLAALGGVAGPQAFVPEEIVTIPALAIAGGIAGSRVGAGVGSYELETGFAYAEYREMGLDHQTATVAAHGVGTINAVLESIGFLAMARTIPGLHKVQGSIANRLLGTVLGKPTMTRASGMVLTRFGEALGTEVVTEALQETVTMVTGEMLRPGGSQLTWDAYTDRISNVAVEVLQGAAIVSSLGPIATFARDSKRAYDAKGMEAVYRVLGDSTRDSRLRENVPSKWREWTDRATAAGSVENVLIDVERFTEYFQDSGMDPDKVAASLGVNLQEARDTRTDLEIPIAAYTDQILTTDHHTGLLPDLKHSEDAMTAREAQHFLANEPELRKALEAQDPESDFVPDPDIYDTVMGWLLANGYDRGSADKQARFIAYSFTTFVERNPNLEMTAVEYFHQRFGGIQVDLPGALQPADIDVHIDPFLERLRAGNLITQRDVYGESLTDLFIRKGGLADELGELEAQDVGKAVRGLIKGTGMTMDAAAEMAFEAGFIPEQDTNQLIEAIAREAGGEPVFGPTADPVLQEQVRLLDELAAFLETEGIDLEKMTNAEIRKQLGGARTLEQTTDFGDITFTDRVAIKGISGTTEITQRAQTVFNRAIKRRDNLKLLLDCVNG